MALPAAFAVACIVLTILMYETFGGTLPLSVTGYRVVVPLPEATNLVSGSDVQIAGVKVGKIVAVNRTGNSAQATIQLKPEFVPLHSGATAIARTKTLLGEGYIELAPGPHDAPPIPDDGRLSASHVTHQVDLDQFISTFDPVTRRRMQQLFVGIASAFHSRSQALNDSLGNAAPFTNNVDAILETLDRQKLSLQQLISSSATVFEAVGHRERVLQSAIEAGDDVFRTTAQRNHALADTISAFGPFLTELHARSDQVTAVSPALNDAVRALLPTALLVSPALRAIDTAAPRFQSLFRELPGVLTTGTHAVRALTSTIGPARGAFKQFYPTSRNLIPFMQLFGVSRTVINLLANLGNLWFPIAEPDGLVGAAGSAIVSLWNESVSGWTHKLPTNRQNPYPEPPDALLGYAKYGILKSYDCRNVHNPLWIPATGGGAAPCIVQGPWVFDGKSAYYPRLQPAPP